MLSDSRGMVESLTAVLPVLSCGMVWSLVVLGSQEAKVMATNMATADGTMFTNLLFMVGVEICLASHFLPG